MSDIKKEDFALFADDTSIPEPEKDIVLTEEEQLILDEILNGDMS